MDGLMDACVCMHVCMYECSVCMYARMDELTGCFVRRRKLTLANGRTACISKSTYNDSRDCKRWNLLVFERCQLCNIPCRMKHLHTSCNDPCRLEPLLVRSFVLSIHTHVCMRVCDTDKRRTQRNIRYVLASRSQNEWALATAHLFR